MKRLGLIGAIAGLGIAVTQPALAGDVEAGKAAAASCVACHGVNGNSTNPLWPKLAGQHAAYLAKQMRDYKAGTRQDPVMGPMSQTINDADIDNIAAYFAAQTQQ